MTYCILYTYTYHQYTCKYLLIVNIYTILICLPLKIINIMPKLALKLYLLLVSELHTIQGDEETLKFGKQLEPLTLTPATRTRGLWSHKTSV